MSAVNIAIVNKCNAITMIVIIMLIQVMNYKMWAHVYMFEQIALYARYSVVGTNTNNGMQHFQTLIIAIPDNNEKSQLICIGDTIIT